MDVHLVETENYVRQVSNKFYAILEMGSFDSKEDALKASKMLHKAFKKYMESKGINPLKESIQ